jgi:magnesium transporter
MKVLREVDVDAIHAARERREYVWIDLVAPSVETVQELGAAVGWSPLLVEDIHHGGQRPKVEDFADHVLVISYAAVHRGGSADVELLEHALVVHGDYLVTVRPIESVEFQRLRESLETQGDGVADAEIVHRVLDQIVDTTMDATDRIAAEVDALEERIDDHTSSEVLLALRSVRRDLINLRGIVAAQLDAHALS